MMFNIPWARHCDVQKGDENKMCKSFSKICCRCPHRIFLQVVLVCAVFALLIVLITYTHTKKINEHDERQHCYMPEETMFCASDAKHPFSIMLGVDKYVVLAVKDIENSYITGYLICSKGEESLIIAESDNCNVLVDIGQRCLADCTYSVMVIRLRDPSMANELYKCKIRLRKKLSGTTLCEITLLHYKKDRDFLRKGILKEILTEKENEQAMGAKK